MNRTRRTDGQRREIGRVGSPGCREHAHYAVALGAISWPRRMFAAPVTRPGPDARPANDPASPRSQGHERCGRSTAPARERTLRQARDRAVSDRPVAAVGVGDWLTDHRPKHARYGQLPRYEKLMGFPTPPVVRGVGPTPIPRPIASTSGSATRSTATRFGTRFDDTTAARALRDEVKQAILVAGSSSRYETSRDDQDARKPRPIIVSGATSSPRPMISPTAASVGTHSAEGSAQTLRRGHRGGQTCI